MLRIHLQYLVLNWRMMRLKFYLKTSKIQRSSELKQNLKLRRSWKQLQKLLRTLLMMKLLKPQQQQKQKIRELKIYRRLRNLFYWLLVTRGLMLEDIFMILQREMVGPFLPSFLPSFPLFKTITGFDCT